MNYQANLVSLHSEEEHQFVVGLHEGSGIPWLGGRRDPGNRETWLWSDGTPWDYTNWAGGQPDGIRNGVEDCAHIWDVNKWNKVYGLWNDAPCTSETTFVCKTGKTKPVICQGDDLLLLGSRNIFVIFRNLYNWRQLNYWWQDRNRSVHTPSPRMSSRYTALSSLRRYS